MQRRGNKSLSLWADIDDPEAPHTHFVKSFAQRRSQIVGDCLQLKTDVDVYNDKLLPAEPIQIPLDFTLDVMELQQPLRRVACRKLFFVSWAVGTDNDIRWSSLPCALPHWPRPSPTASHPPAPHPPLSP